MPRPQFSLKAILVIVAVLSVPLGMAASGHTDLALSGTILGLPALFGCIGYLLCRWEGAAIGVLAAAVLLCVLASFFYRVVQ